ncbi:glycosyltransferase family 2 protein [Xylanimonas oleitrophica]|uniref:4,4'-diaponeurosporenoate glycosyltransferase n=1 Tax=Xylanimonas oleitrophica TaxID=2607479 RepID=A0A2W5WU64_9MICO|nr:glycosyltransferase family 2 protein [Xylanimonas oleitrophica]PZR54163.1 glycosyltransferase family 2 protein [Xylanimonas oleitrophica]
MTASRPTVSVVIPVRDDAVALERCLDRLARQTRPADEVVVVDNASDDDSAAVARRYGARVVEEPRVGIPHAAATGYDAATGDVIVRCDADSVPGPRWLERLVGRLADREDLDAVTGVGVFHDARPGLRVLTAVVYLGAYYAATHLALGHTPLWGSNMAVRRRTWVAVAGQVHRDEDVHDDMDLAFVLGPHRRVRLVPVSVGVSVRSVRGGAQMRRRFARARRTLQVNWAVSPPWRRWAERCGAPGQVPTR